MKKMVILTSMLCAYNAAHADASCCGTKRKQECVTSTSENAKKFMKAPMETGKKTKTASGLEYTILKPAESTITPKPGATVTVHYTGWLKNDNLEEVFEFNKYDGTQFDSSVDRKKPFQFKIGVGTVIRGWDEGVMGMKVGEKRRLYIPANLGYGARGAGAVIPPNADLIFDVELIDVSK